MQDGSLSALYNIEDNSDFNSSNDSYMSSDEDADEENCDDKEKNACSINHEPTREDRAIIRRRFEPYFDR